MSRQTVLLLFGGESSEHDVSIMSARNVYAAMDNAKYEVKLCYIDTHGKWWMLHEWHENFSMHDGMQVAVVPGAKGLIMLPGGNVVHVDVAFPVLHGKNGEDGTVQGLLETAHIPYVGCGIEASAVCMDKAQAKRVLSSANSGISVVPWMEFSKNDDYRAFLTRDLRESHEEGKKRSDLVGSIGSGPWFVKPSRAGSSVGVTKVSQFEDLADAIQVALEHDDIALVETAIVGRELEVAVLGNPPSCKASGVGEIIAGDEFYSYDDKYSQASQSKVIVNADLPEALKKVIRDTALKAYQALGCKGLARVDFLLDEGQAPYINEINTLPGFTNISMYPKLWHETGMKYPQLVDKLIELALE
ncbi:D-alanine--D-alanine ligase [Candidatus Saccharibacteria bacterium]|nr:D-alanine--D-alanine ligase [Candidatus Saccharibacteria bacterium]